MLNKSYKDILNSSSLSTTQHFSLLKQKMLDNFLLFQHRKKLKQKKLKQKKLKFIFLKNLKVIKHRKLKKSKSRLRFKKPYKKVVRRIQKKLYPIFKKTFVSKRFNKSKFRLPKNCVNLFKYCLAISIKKNNVFCTFSTIRAENKTLISSNAGSYKIKVTKKTLRYTYDLVLNKFYNGVKKKVSFLEKANKKKKKANNKMKNKQNILTKALKRSKRRMKTKIKKGLIATIVIPKRLRKKVVKSIRYHFKKIPLLIKVVDKKVFNGCRAPKSIRKKRRRRLRLYK